MVGSGSGLETLKAQHFQPMRMRLSRQQFSWCFADSLWLGASQEWSMVQVKAQKLQVFVANFPSQKKVTAQTAMV